MHGSFSLTPTDYIKFNLTGKTISGHVIIVEKSTGSNLIIENGTTKDITVDDTVIFQVAGNVLYSIIVLR